MSAQHEKRLHFVHCVANSRTPNRNQDLLVNLNNRLGWISCDVKLRRNVQVRVERRNMHVEDAAQGSQHLAGEWPQFGGKLIFIEFSRRGRRLRKIFCETFSLISRFPISN